MAYIVPLHDKDGVVVNLALVDDADRALVSQHSWHLTTKGYARAKIKGKAVKMHQLLLPKAPAPLMVRDHINGDKLDNRRRNLRWCSQGHNLQNRGLWNKTGFRGVGKCSSRAKPWRATITFQGKSVHCGYHATPEEAALAYDRMAIQLYGAEAATNF